MVIVPNGLKYLPFQIEDIQHIVKGYKSGHGTLIASEPGVGKTIEVLGSINLTPQLKKILIVCPLSLRMNWAVEAKRWLVQSYYTHLIKDPRWKITQDNVFVVANYQQLQNAEIAESIKRYNWDLMVFDEGRYLRAGSKTNYGWHILGTTEGGGPNKGILDNGKLRLVLDGTPIPNRPHEAWILLHLANPAAWPSQADFMRLYCEGKRGYSPHNASRLDELGARMRTTGMLRRTKAEVLSQLPAKRFQLILLEPASVLVGREQSLLATLSNLNDSQSLPFRELADIRRANGEAKLPLIVDHLNDILKTPNRKVVVFWYHPGLAEKCAASLPKISSVVYTGSTPADQRQGLVDRFQTDPNTRLFIGTLGAACSGITLTAANTMVIAELGWRPDEVEQAIDRIFRVGQVNPVTIQLMAFDNTIDARMAKILVDKMDIAKEVLG